MSEEKKVRRPDKVLVVELSSVLRLVPNVLRKSIEAKVNEI
jgi:hypothetical protein